MEKCSCYHEYDWITSSGAHGCCYGTRECDPCSCEGDMAKCNFYPEKREKAKKELTTAEMWIAAQEDGEVYVTDFHNTTYSKEEGFASGPEYKYSAYPSLNEWMNKMWRKQEKRKLTREEAEKEFGIKIVD